MVDGRIDDKHLPDGRAEDAGTLSSLRLDGGMMVGEGGVMLPFVGVGVAAAVGEVVAGCGMERGPISPAAGGGDAGVNIGWSGGGGDRISHFSLNGECSGRGWLVEEGGRVSHIDH